MNVRNILIFSSTAALNGAWVDISNMVSFSVQVDGLEGKVWIEVSNDPNVQFNGSNGQLGTPSAYLSQYTPTDNYGNSSGLPTQALSIKLTYTTHNQPVVTPTPIYSTVVGETLPGGAASIVVAAGSVCIVASPPADAAGIAKGYNVYAQLNGSGPYVLQNTRGGPYASITPMFDGPIPLGTPFVMSQGFYTSGTIAPIADTSGGPGSGANILGTNANLASGLTFSDNPIAVIPDTGTGNIIVAPSCMSWKWLRVCKSTTATMQTNAWLCGQLG